MGPVVQRDPSATAARGVDRIDDAEPADELRTIVPRVATNILVRRRRDLLHVVFFFVERLVLARVAVLARAAAGGQEEEQGDRGEEAPHGAMF